MGLRILGYNGQPLSGTTVKVYQLADRPGLGHVITEQIKFAGTTDADGLFTLPNVPIDSALVPPIGTGDVLHDNPFGYVSPTGSNGVFYIRIEYNGFVDDAWLDITEANIAYWQGQTDVAVFDRQVSLGGPVQTVPPADMAELNAGDWQAWAQNASGTLSDDPTRKIAGAASIKFVTNGGFDTYIRYPGNINARWNLSESDLLNISFYAENPSPSGFQSGSPWIRLYDADGHYFQFQYYQNGGVSDILNEARGAWKSYQIPLNADSTVQNGWRRTTFGTPQLAAISSLEIHADTWDYGFTLWVDGIGFAPAPLVPGDYNRDQTVDAADYVVWRKTVGTSVTPYSGADGNGNGLVEDDDRNVWRTYFGQSPSVGSVTGMGASTNQPQVVLDVSPTELARVDNDPLANLGSATTYWAASFETTETGTFAARVSQLVRATTTTIAGGFGSRYVSPAEEVLRLTAIPDRRRAAPSGPLTGNRQTGGELAASQHDEALVAWLALVPDRVRRPGEWIESSTETRSSSSSPDELCDRAGERLDELIRVTRGDVSIAL